FLLLLLGAVFQAAAQPTDANRTLLAEIRAQAEKGAARCQVEVGDIFAEGRLGVAQDAVEAVRWYRQAAEQRHAGAEFRLGVCYQTGQGVARDDGQAV